LLRARAEQEDGLAWRARGVCRDVDPEVFFPAPSEPADEALALCQGCDVQGPCLAWALQVGDCHGVWGATTARERRAMLVAWRNDDVEDVDTTFVPALRVLADAAAFRSPRHQPTRELART
jgi:hypothetical protein